jgi:hypothetical protein
VATTTASAEAAGPELARQLPREDDRRRTRDRRRQPEGRERVAQHGACHRGHQGDERRVIHVAPVKVFAAGDVIELVAEPAVALEDDQVKRELHAGEPQDDGMEAGHRGLR